MELMPDRQLEREGRSGGLITPAATSLGVYSDELADKGFLLGKDSGPKLAMHFGDALGV